MLTSQVFLIFKFSSVTNTLSEVGELIAGNNNGAMVAWLIYYTIRLTSKYILQITTSYKEASNAMLECFWKCPIHSWSLMWFASFSLSHIFFSSFFFFCTPSSPRRFAKGKDSIYFLPRLSQHSGRWEIMEESRGSESDDHWAIPQEAHTSLT